VVGDGHSAVKVISRFGRLELKRQVLSHSQGQETKHTMPGNQALPVHNGLIVSRGVQEMVCLFSLDLPFATVERLLSWHIQEESLLSSTTNRTLIRAHGQIIRQAEAAEVEALLAQDEWSGLRPQLVASNAPRRQASWPAEMQETVAQALAVGQVTPPQGVSLEDWERVIANRRTELPDVENLRRLGPQLKADQVMACVDEVLTRKPEKRSFWELRTAYVATVDGHRYLSGIGPSFLTHLLVLLLILGVQDRRNLLLIADGARWIRNFFAQSCLHFPNAQILLDWYHLRHKLSSFASMICRGKAAKIHFLSTLGGYLWRGNTQAALEFLRAYRPETKSDAKLDELIDYLHARQEAIPNYQERRKHRLYIGSALVEKANDLIVARRQKNKGMHWSLESSDSLAALKTLMLNDGWNLYWEQRQVLPLVAS
jgi:hypothetical protein